MDVKPWEPIGGWWIPHGFDPLRYQEGMSWPWYAKATEKIKDHPCRVTLANGQRIIVRALSDERKAARAAMKEAVS